MKTKFLIILILLITAILYFLPLKSPPGFNADEAAYGYNAYSILKTGRDEYGTFLPLRLKSFGDYKLPLYTYLTIPFIKLFGLSEASTRIVAGLSGFLLVLVIYAISKELFNQKVALISLALGSVSAWIHPLAQHAHETTLATLLIGLSLLFLIKYAKSKQNTFAGLSLLFTTLSLFAYHTAKVIAPFLFLALLYYLYQNKKTVCKVKHNQGFLILMFIAVIIGSIYLISEIKSPPARITSLFILNHPDIALRTNEAKIEARFSPFGNKYFISGIQIVNRYLSYFSPEFLVVKGDENPRFGYDNISLLTAVEYIFFLVGAFYLFSKKPKHAWLLGLVLLIPPFGGSLTWQKYSYTRIHPMILAILPLAASGFYYLLSKYKKILFIPLVISLFLSLTSLYFFFIHYPRRAYAIRSWQPGYKELTDYIKENYSKYDHFYITNKNGQPYIMLLFYLQYPPKKYQEVAKLSEPDGYGFGQVEAFAKFSFAFKDPENVKNGVIVGYSEDFGELNTLDQTRIKKISAGPEEIFWIYEQ